jgi:hypothetical protein
MSELPLDHDERYALVGHLAACACPSWCGANRRLILATAAAWCNRLRAAECFPAPARGRSVDYAQQRPGRQLAADLLPGVKLLPRPTIHPDFASLAALPAPDEHRTSGGFRPLSWRASASPIRRPARQSSTIRLGAGDRRIGHRPYALPRRSPRPPAGRPGTARPYCVAGGLGDCRAWSPVTDGGRRRPAARIP